HPRTADPRAPHRRRRRRPGADPAGHGGGPCAAGRGRFRLRRPHRGGPAPRRAAHANADGPGCGGSRGAVRRPGRAGAPGPGPGRPLDRRVRQPAGGGGAAAGHAGGRPGGGAGVPGAVPAAGGPAGAPFPGGRPGRLRWGRPGGRRRRPVPGGLPVPSRLHAAPDSLPGDQAQPVAAGAGGGPGRGPALWAPGPDPGAPGPAAAAVVGAGAVGAGRRGRGGGRLRGADSLGQPAPGDAVGPGTAGSADPDRMAGGPPPLQGVRLRPRAADPGPGPGGGPRPGAGAVHAGGRGPDVHREHLRPRALAGGGGRHPLVVRPGGGRRAGRRAGAGAAPPVAGGLRRCGRPAGGTAPVSRRVVISGYYGFDNMGDEMVLAGILAGLRRLDPGVRVTVLSAHPAATAREHGVDAVSRTHLPSILAALARADLLISGGGSLLQDVTGPFNIPYYVGVMELARLRGVPVMMMAQGIGPVRGRMGRALVRWAVRRAAAVTVRDPQSARLLGDLGVPGAAVGVTADAALLLDPGAGAGQPSPWEPPGEGP